MDTPAVIPPSPGIPFMFNVQRVRCGVFITLLLSQAVAPLQVQAAEPLSMFLLKLLRDQAISAGIENAVTGASVPPPAPLTNVYGITEEQLRGLIDEGFVHLTPAQRAEVYSSLTRILTDPKNALSRPLIIEELAVQASVVRGTLERLSALTITEKRAIVADARAEYARLSEEDRGRLVQLLQARVAPIPRDLNDQILAAILISP